MRHQNIYKNVHSTSSQHKVEHVKLSNIRYKTLIQHTYISYLPYLIEATNSLSYVHNMGVPHSLYQAAMGSKSLSNQSINQSLDISTHLRGSYPIYTAKSTYKFGSANISSVNRLLAIRLPTRNAPVIYGCPNSLHGIPF